MQKTAYDMRVSDWSSDVCSSDLDAGSDRPADCHRAGADRRFPAGGVSRWPDRGNLPTVRDHHFGIGDYLRFCRPHADTRFVRVAHQTGAQRPAPRSEEHTSELQSLMRISYAVFCLKQKTTQPPITTTN